MVFKELGIADDILIVGYNNSGADHHKMLHTVLYVCRKENMKLNKVNVISHVHLFHFVLGGLIYRHGVRPGAPLNSLQLKFHLDRHSLHPCPQPPQL